MPAQPASATQPTRKPWWRSRVMWFNTICAAVAAAEAGAGLLQPLLPVNVYALLVFALTVGNSVLRVLTNQGLAQGKDAP